VSVDDVSDVEGWKDVKASLIKQVGGGSIPSLYVEEARKSGALVLGHEHDGRDLDVNETDAVLDHIYYLWDDKVILNTIVDGQLRKLET
jgi:stage V sporulation protein R